MDRPLAVETGEMPEPVQFERGHAADIEGCRSDPLRRHHRHVPAQPGRRAIRGRTSIDTGRNAFEPTAPYIVMDRRPRSEEHTSELQSLMRISYAVLCLKKKKKKKT